MIRLTKATDYGIVLLTSMAGRPLELTNATELAQHTHLPLPMVSKILKQLAREGVLQSHRGAKGGYTLARPPAQLSIAEIITALEGPIAMTECADTGPHDCSYESFCSVRSNLKKINQAVRSSLEEISLEEMARPLFASVAEKSGPTESVPLVSLGN